MSVILKIASRLVSAALTIYTASAAAQVVLPTTPEPLQPAQALAQPDCSINPDLCMAAPVAHGCGAGRKWSSKNDEARCIDDVPKCLEGEAPTRNGDGQWQCSPIGASSEEDSNKPQPKV